MMEENIFEGCEDNYFAEADYENELKIAQKKSINNERQQLMVLSERYLDTLAKMQAQADETEQKISGIFIAVSQELSKNADEIQKQAERALQTIKKQSLHTEKIVRITSREHRLKFFTLLAVAFFGGIVMTVFVYHAFIIGIMNKYLHHTIEVMAQTEINNAKREADLILRNANIKADGILKNADFFANKNNGKSLEGGE